MEFLSSLCVICRFRVVIWKYMYRASLVRQSDLYLALKSSLMIISISIVYTITLYKLCRKNIVLYRFPGTIDEYRKLLWLLHMLCNVITSFIVLSGSQRRTSEVCSQDVCQIDTLYQLRSQEGQQNRTTELILN